MVVHLFGRKNSAAQVAPPPLVAPHERIYAIGDVHGRYDLLIELLALIHADATNLPDGRATRLVFLGDLIDRGEDTKAVLAALLTLTSDPAAQVDLVRGNHEDALIDFLEDPVAGAAWLEFGGLQTFSSFRVAPPRSLTDRAELARARDDLAAELVPFHPVLRRLRPWVRSGDVVFCHASIDPARPVDEQDEAVLTWGDPGFLTDVPVPGLRVVHGHFDGDAPVSRPGRVCVDTGAYYSGVLTAVRLDEGEAFLSTGPAARSA